MMSTIRSPKHPLSINPSHRANSHLFICRPSSTSVTIRFFAVDWDSYVARNIVTAAHISRKRFRLEPLECTGKHPNLAERNVHSQRRYSRRIRSGEELAYQPYSR
ncbi:hypothetical protein M404DRAFT_1000631 [Pisolithus tinctorius Marx 270]|uniref:Uncharacterized protein n=1 Tax=Pisolithus tinctorius Marx 270 TaxID=870435 RepID=A0A0C3J617_PISTI|nr:hypothetical protein M404DRAFT_1000631 [Pisolithus tinctorius Marx 270]